jgi:hypothetical protein
VLGVLEIYGRSINTVSTCLCLLSKMEWTRFEVWKLSCRMKCITLLHTISCRNYTPETLFLLCFTAYPMMVLPNLLL